MLTSNTLVGLPSPERTSFEGRAIEGPFLIFSTYCSGEDNTALAVGSGVLHAEAKLVAAGVKNQYNESSSVDEETSVICSSSLPVTNGDKTGEITGSLLSVFASLWTLSTTSVNVFLL